MIDLREAVVYKLKAFGYALVKGLLKLFIDYAPNLIEAFFHGVAYIVKMLVVVRLHGRKPLLNGFPYVGQRT